jgi:ribosomal-protein-alanine N-acetyltransferase
MQGRGCYLNGMVEILTPRLRLRRAQSNDLNALHMVLSNAAAMRYWSTPPNIDLQQTREWLDSMIAAAPENSDDFVVEHCRRVIGKAGCWKVPEIGFILHPDYWGRGLAHEALTAVIERVFASFAIGAIEADVDPRNARCIALLNKLGFAEVRRAERTWKVGEEWCDSVYLFLQRSQGVIAPSPPAEIQTETLPRSPLQPRLRMSENERLRCSACRNDDVADELICRRIRT